MMPYIDKEDSDLRPCVSAHEPLQISCYRYWLTACARPYSYKLTRLVTARVVRRQNTHPYAAHIATILTKKHNMSSFFEDFRQKFSRTWFPVHTAMWRPYNPAMHNGRHTGR